MGVSCSQAAREVAVSPAASAPCYEAYLLVELRAPWSARLWGSRFLDAELEAVLSRIERDKGKRLRVQAVLPDPAWCDRDTTMVVLWERGPQPLGAWARREFRFPCDAVAAGVESLAFGAGAASRSAAADVAGASAGAGADFDVTRFEVAAAHWRDLLVCAHASRDDCCGRGGPPVYKALREAIGDDGDVRVWRSSHLGGHRFAPTMLDLPSARLWGRVDETSALAVLARSAAPSSLSDCYRGWASLPAPLQMLEREAFFAQGWRWLEHMVTPAVEQLDENRWRVRLEAREGADAEPQVWEAFVRRAPEAAVTIPPSCGAEPEQHVPLTLEKLRTP